MTLDNSHPSPLTRRAFLRAGAVGASTLLLPDRVLAFGSPARTIRNREPGEPYLGGVHRGNALQLRLDYTA